jgi:hypothetical protein
MYIINWTVMLFYKHLCPFWIRYTYMHASILVQLSSFVHHFLFLSLSLCWYLLFVLIDRRKGKKSIILLLLSFLSFSLFLSRKYFLLLYIHIYQSEEVRTLTRRFFFLLYWPNLAPTLLLSWFFYSLLRMPTYKNRVCIYIHTYQKESSVVYIQERCTILYSYSLVFLLIRIY